MTAHPPEQIIGAPEATAATGSTDPYYVIDQAYHAAAGKMTSGLAMSVLAEAWMDWATHMAMSPGKQAQLYQQAVANTWELWQDAMTPAAEPTDTPVIAHRTPSAKATKRDRRFKGDAWQRYPYNVWAKAHTMGWQWWQDATTGVHGTDQQHEDLMAFVAGQLVDATAPSNFPLTNPDVIAATVTEGGQNLVRGAQNLIQDAARLAGAPAPDTDQPFQVGRDLAITPGKVVFRNALVELIQYAPATGAVHPEPLLIVPAWIMKYYILDLSPENSLVRYLVSQGFSVFVLSWKNPDADDRDMGMEDYRRLGIMDSIDAIQAITGATQVHAMGYCLGGTLLSIAAAAMARDGDDRFASLTFLAAQIDFTEAGALRLFINDSEVTLIEDMMAQTGYLSSEQMAGAFALLHARDLIWAPAIRNYMLGDRGKSFDLMAWNADATRMPYRMHSQYLRKLFLNNDLAEGRYLADGKAVAMGDLRTPLFVVGTEEDHVAPWRSVYKFHLFGDGDVTFVLTNGGHNAGIVSEPGHKHRHFRIADTPAHTPYRDPAQWLDATSPQDGSWWVAYSAWLAARSGPMGDVPPMGAPSGPYRALCDAPGTYVMQP